MPCWTSILADYGDIESMEVVIDGCSAVDKYTADTAVYADRTAEQLWLLAAILGWKRSLMMKNRTMANHVRATFTRDRNFTHSPSPETDGIIFCGQSLIRCQPFL